VSRYACTQRSSIAAGGGFYNVQPGTAAWLCNIVDVKNCCLALFVRRNRCW